MSILDEISESLQKGRVKAVKELVAQAIDEKITASEILDQGLISGMNIIGVKFKSGDIFIPEVMIAARAMNAGTEVLRPLLAGEGVKSAGRVCIGTVKGDKHDIGKNLVKMMMEGKGLEVIDLGIDVPPQKFLETAISRDCKIVACSALLTTTLDMMRQVVQTFQENGMRDKVKIMIGGAPVTEEYRRKIGADSYTPDAASAADVAFAFCQEC